MSPARRVPPDFFGFGFGLAGPCETWRIAELYGRAPEGVGDDLTALSALAWLSVLLAYLRFAVSNRSAFRRDLADPVVAPFLSLALITPMLLAVLGLVPHEPSPGRLLFDVFVVLTVLLGSWLTGQWMCGTLQLDNFRRPAWLRRRCAHRAARPRRGDARLRGAVLSLSGRSSWAGCTCAPCCRRRCYPCWRSRSLPPAVASLAWFDSHGDHIDTVASFLAGFGVLMMLAQVRWRPPAAAACSRRTCRPALRRRPWPAARNPTAGDRQGREITVVPNIADPVPGVAVASARGRWILVAVVLGSGIAGIDSAAMNVALAVIGRDLSADFTQLQWTVTGYTLSLAALVLLSGALGDRYGRRRVFLTGVAGFAGASVLCAIAPGIDALIGARSLQGIGGALMLPASLAVIQSSFRPEDRPRAVGIWSGFTGVATLTAPFAAGWLLGLGTWRWIFVINVPVAAVLVLVALRHVPESRQAAPAPIDWAGSLLAVVALAAVTYVLMVTPGWRSAAAALITATAIAVGACAAFVWHERRSPAPMLPAAVLRSVPFITANLVAFFVYGAFGAFSLVFTIALETISGYSPLKAGSTILPVTIITLALSGPSGQLSARLGPRLQLSAGPVLCAAAALLAARVSASTGYWTSVIPLECVFGLGIAATVPPLTSAMLYSIPGDHAGIASGMTNAVTRAASLIWIAALPPLAGLSGSAYASAAALRGGYREICVICAAGLALAGALAVLTPARRWRQCARS